MAKKTVTVTSIVVVAIIGLIIYMKSTASSVPIESLDQVDESQKWEKNGSYEYQLLPNGTKVAKQVFNNSSISLGKNVIDNVTMHYQFGNPAFNPKSGVYNPALYEKNDGVYTIKVQEIRGYKALYFYSEQSQSNRMANLHLLDNDLRDSPAVEGMIIEKKPESILELVHYAPVGKTIQDFKSDSTAFQNIATNSL